MKRFVLRAGLLVISLGAVVCILVWSSLLTRLSLGRQASDVLANAVRVEVFRLHPNPRNGFNGPKIGEFAILRQGRDQGPEFASRLAKVLFRPQAHFASPAKCFWPGIAFRIWRGQECVEVPICFFCHNLQMITHNSDGAVVQATEDRGFTEGVWDDLLALAKEALPDDPDIQGLSRDTRDEHLTKLLKTLSEPAPSEKGQP